MGKNETYALRDKNDNVMLNIDETVKVAEEFCTYFNGRQNNHDTNNCCRGIIQPTGNKKGSTRKGLKECNESVD